MIKRPSLVFGTKLVKEGDWIKYEPLTILGIFQDEKQAEQFQQQFGGHIAHFRQFDSAEEAVETIRAEQAQLENELEQLKRSRS